MKKNIINKLASMIVLVYFVLYLLSQITQHDYMQLRWILGITGFLSVLDISKAKSLEIKLDKKNIKRIMFILLMFVFTMLSMMYTRNIALVGNIYSIHYIGIALLITNYVLNLRMVKISFYLHVTFFLFLMISQYDPNNTLNSSRNYISVIILIQIVLLYISTYQNNRKYSFLPAILNVIICLWAVGRSGIIVSLILLAGIIVRKIYKEKPIKFIIFIIAVIILVFIILSRRIDLISIIEKALMNFSSKGFESGGRRKIIEEYIRIIINDPKDLFFGVSIKGNPVFDSYSNNLHNSYIRCHSFYGMGGSLLIMTGILVAVKHLIEERKILLLALLVGICIRIFTDVIAFNGIIDPLIYYFIMNDRIFNRNEVEKT